MSATPVVMAPADVVPAMAMLRSVEHDAIVALVVSWVEPPLFVATLRPFFGETILLWSHTIYQENGVGLTLGALPAAGVLRETLEEMEVRFVFVYGMPLGGEPALMDAVRSFARAAAARAKERTASISAGSPGMP